MLTFAPEKKITSEQIRQQLHEHLVAGYTWKTPRASAVPYEPNIAALHALTLKGIQAGKSTALRMGVVYRNAHIGANAGNFGGADAVHVAPR